MWHDWAILESSYKSSPNIWWIFGLFWKTFWVFTLLHLLHQTWVAFKCSPTSTDPLTSVASLQVFYTCTDFHRHLWTECSILGRIFLDICAPSILVELRTLFLMHRAEGQRARVLSILSASHLVPDLVWRVGRLHGEGDLAAVVEVGRRRGNGTARLIQERRW